MTVVASAKTDAWVRDVLHADPGRAPQPSLAFATGAPGAPGGKAGAQKQAGTPSVAAPAPPLDPPPDQNVPALGVGATDAEIHDSAKRVTVRTSFGPIAYMKIQAHSVNPLLAPLIKALADGQKAVEAVKAGLAAQAIAVKPLAPFIDAPGNAEKEIGATAWEDAAGDARTAELARTDKALLDRMAHNVNVQLDLVRSGIEQALKELKAHSNDKRAAELREKGEKVESAVDLVSEALKDGMIAGEGGPAAVAGAVALSVARNLYKIIHTNKDLEQAKELEAEARDLLSDAAAEKLASATAALADLAEDVDAIANGAPVAAQVEKRDAKIARDRFDQTSKSKFKFGDVAAAQGVTDTLLAAATASYGAWRYAIELAGDLEKAFATFEYSDGSGAMVPVDGKNLGGGMHYGGIISSAVDEMHAADFVKENAPTIDAIRKAAQTHFADAQVQQAAAIALQKKLGTLMERAFDALKETPGKNFKRE